MPKKAGTTSIFLKTPISSQSHYPSPPLTSSESIMDDNIETAEMVITKWDSGFSTYAAVTSLFRDNREEAREYLTRVIDLHNAMQYAVTENSSSKKLVCAQNLMKMAMKRLEKEFYQILQSNRNYQDPETVSSRTSRASRSSLSDIEDESESEDELRQANESIADVERPSDLAVSDLSAIADCMISSGYAKECVKIYNIVRKSIVDESLHHLGVERPSLSQAQKIDWDVMELKIKNWLNAVKIVVKTLFYRERLLCDHVFHASSSIRESSFAEISRQGSLTLFGFPELVAKCKRSSEKIFRTLDLYGSISQLWPEIESIFSFESTSSIRSQVLTSLVKLGEAVRIMLTDFESAIQKESSKSPLPGAGVHPLTRYVMNYITFLADYSEILADIFADWPLELQTPLPEEYFGSLQSDGNPISIRLAWLVLLLLCKLDGKAEYYKDVSLSYLFLANNLQYVVGKVRTSKLSYLIGEGWVRMHDSKVKQYAANYERMGWSSVFDSLPSNFTVVSPEVAKEIFKKFNTAFEETYKRQISWIIPNSKLRDEIKISVAKKIVPAYRQLYVKFRTESFVRFAPDDLDNYLSDLFCVGGPSGSTASSSSSSHSRGRQSYGGMG